MCSHIINSSSPPYPTIVYNRTQSKTNPLQQLGAKVASSPEEVAEQSDIVFTIVGYPSDVRSVYLGDGSTSHTGILAKLRPGSIAIDMTTSEPSLAQQIHTVASSHHIYSIDAPVSGGDIGAKNATLSIMIGGQTEAITAITPLLQAMGKNITHMGGAGAGQHTKMVNQILIATNMIGVCEGLLYAHKAGLDPSIAIQAVSAGAAGSWSISNLGPRMIARNFEPGFYVEHFVKDLSIVLSESRRMNLSLPGLSLAYSLYMALMAQGRAKKGTQALYLALETLNGIQGTTEQHK
jgi:3-hydroxyisobutyrate dehydrogenase